MQDTKQELVENIKYMPSVDDLIKQQDTDATQWALAFKRTITENNFTMDDMKDESYMVGWFANAMMTQHDWMHNNNQLPEIQEVVLDNKIDSLKEMIEVQKGSLTDSYMCGMANGMIYALSILDNKDPEFVKDVSPTRSDKELIEKLWQIIDDIDTISDMAKGDDKFYRRLVEQKQKERWDLPIETDGYKLYINEPLPDPSNIIYHVTSEPEYLRPQCKISCEWDMGFEYIYDNYEEAVKAIEEVDWNEAGYDTWQEVEAEGLLSIEEV